MSAMSTRHLERATVRETHTVTADKGPLVAWYAAAAALFFAVPLIGTDWLGLQPDLFYLGYFTVAVVFVTTFVVLHATELKELWTLHLWQSIVIGALVGATLAIGIFQQSGTAHAEGWRFGFEIAWRGVVYGSVDALTLYLFPAAIAYLLMHRNRAGLKRKAAFAGLTLVLSMFVTATYHLGYTEFRDQTIRYPEIGAVMANIPTALTGNPVGAVVVHTTMHVSSIVHQRDGGTQHMLPPRVDSAYPNHGSSDLAAGLAAGWLVAAAAALSVLVRRPNRRLHAHHDNKEGDQP
jgi:formate/nitrite transporter FocA (FNT family)